MEDQSTILNGLVSGLLLLRHLGAKLDAPTHNPVSLNGVVEIGTWVGLASVCSEWADLLAGEFSSIGEIVVPVDSDEINISNTTLSTDVPLRVGPKSWVILEGSQVNWCTLYPCQ